MPSSRFKSNHGNKWIGGSNVRREVVIRLNRQGQYIVDGHVNNAPVRFLVDTGANRTSMTDEKADAIGLDWRNWKKTTSWSAGGPTESWSGTLHSVRIGDIEVTTGVRGGVLPDMNIRNADALLGMSFLSQIEFTQDDGVLILHDGTEETMAKDSSDRWWDKEDPDPKEEVEEMINESEVKRLRREEELAQAEHEAKLAELERREAVAKGTPPPVVSEVPVGMGNGGGVLGLWWLSPGEAVSIGIAAMLTLFFFGMGSLVADGEPEWATTDGTILKSEHGWEVWENCDDYECWDEIDCYAYVDYSYRVNEIEYVKVDVYQDMWIDYDYEGAEFDCEDDVEIHRFPVEGFVQVWYDVENPGDSELDEPVDASIVLFFCCMPIFLLILVVTLVNARFSNGPKYSEVSAVQGQPGHAVVHHHHGGRGWGSGNFFFFGGVPGGRGGRRHFRRKVTGGGRSRRGGGGRSRSGGGGRSRSGGRRR